MDEQPNSPSPCPAEGESPEPDAPPRPAAPGEWDPATADPSALRRSQGRLIGAAAMWSIWANTSMGGVHRLFVMCLGGRDAIHMGLLQASIQLSILGQLVGLHLVRRLGKTRLVVLGRLLSAGPALGLIVLAAVGWQGAGGVALAIGAYAAMNLLYAVGSTSWWPLIQDNAAPNERGAFLARIRVRLRAVDVLVPIAVGAFLGRQPQAWRFTLPFAVAAASLLAAAWLILGVRSSPLPPMDVPLPVRLRLAWRNASIRRCTVFIVLHTFLLGLTAPLWQYMLKEHRGLPDAYVVWTTAVSALGHLAGLRLWAWLADTHGFRSIVTLSTTSAAAMGLFWLAIPPGGWGVMLWAVVFFLLWGFIEGGLLMGRTTAMLAAVPRVYQAEGLTLAMMSFALGDAIGSLTGGGILDLLARRFPDPAWPDPKALYLAAAQVLMLLLLLPARRLAGREGQTPTPQIAALLWRRLTGREEP